MNIPDRHHPIWKIISNMTSLLIILTVTASNFDSSELKTILAFLATNGMTETLFNKK